MIHITCDFSIDGIKKLMFQSIEKTIREKVSGIHCTIHPSQTLEIKVRCGKENKMTFEVSACCEGFREMILEN